MNFGRAKTILIILFAIVNIFLASYIFVTSTDNTTPNSKTVSDTIEILKSRNVYLADNIKLTTSENINFLNLKGITSDEKVIASKLLGEFTVNGSTYKSDFGDLTINNGEFVLNCKDNHTFYEINDKSVEKYAIKFLKDREIDLTSLKAIKTEREDGNYKVTFAHYFLDKPIFNLNTYVYVSGGGVYMIKGSIFNLESISPASNTNNPINVLLNFSANKNTNEKFTIVSVNGGYFTENNPADFKSVSAIPCYEIVLSDGKRLYYDAISATAIK